MLPLPTEATTEAMNVCTDRRHLFHTYYVHRTKHRSQHRRRGEGHGILEWEGVIEALTPLLQATLFDDFNILMAAQANVIVSGLFFIACKLFRQIPV